MGYIGNEPTTGHFPVDNFTSSGGSTYTLTRVPASAGAIEVSVQGVLQPTTAYTVSGTTLTMAGVTTGVKIFVRHLGETLTLPTPADGSVTTAKLGTNSVDGTKIAMGSDARGDILYHGATDYARLAKGTSGQILTMGANDPAWATAAAGGKVLQIVSSTTAAGSGWNTASTSLVDVGGPWTVAITCAATSSKVLVIASLSVTVQDYVNAQADGSVILVRDSTALTNVNNAANFGIEIGAETGGWTRTSNHGTLHILDSPSSTSELVYKLQYACKSGDAIYISYHGQSTITLMEIGA